VRRKRKFGRRLLAAREVRMNGPIAAAVSKARRVMVFGMAVNERDCSRVIK
jgi:hypothetical protein